MENNTRARIKQLARSRNIVLFNILKRHSELRGLQPVMKNNMRPRKPSERSIYNKEISRIRTKHKKNFEPRKLAYFRNINKAKAAPRPDDFYTKSGLSLLKDIQDIRNDINNNINYNYNFISQDINRIMETVISIQNLFIKDLQKLGGSENVPPAIMKMDEILKSYV